MKEELNESMTVIVPENPTSAISRGAAIHAKDQRIVVCRKSRDSVGIIGYRSFKKGVDDENDDNVVALPSGKRVVRDRLNFAFTRVRLLKDYLATC